MTTNPTNELPDGPHPPTTATTTQTGTIAAQAHDAQKVYGKGDTAVCALDGVDLALHAGEFTAIMGPSGSGKSTLMHCMAGLDTLTSGRIEIGGTFTDALSERELTKLRRRQVGFVFQAFNLLPTLDARENAVLPLALDGEKVDPSWYTEVITRLGLEDRMKHTPTEMSGGQQQRVAVARALLSRPAVLFADEPTGNLDQRSGSEVLALLRSAVDDTGQTIAMVTHDANAASHADRVVFLVDGRIVHELRTPSADAIYDAMKSLGSEQG